MLTTHAQLGGLRGFSGEADLALAHVGGISASASSSIDRTPF